MKTCISLYSYAKLYAKGNFTHFDGVEQTKKFGMDGVEIQFSEAAIPAEYTAAAFAKALTDHARSIGLDVPMYTVAANLYCKDPEAELRRLCGHIDIAAACGIPMMRHDITHGFLGDEPSKNPQTVIKAVAPYIRRLADYAEAKGVRTCSENHGRLMQDSLRMEALFTEVSHKNYGLLCDMGNFGGVDEDCAAAMSRLIPHICYVHAKDSFTRSGMRYNPGRGYRRTRGGNYRRATIFGHGDVPTFQILAALKEAGYDGYVSLEFEGMEDNIPALDIGSENLKRMLADLAQEG